MLVLGTVIDQEQEPRRRQALHQAVQERLGLGIDPVQILEDQTQRLDLAFTQQQVLDGLEGAPAALRGIEGLPLRIVDGHLQQRQQGWQRRLQGAVERQQLARDLLTDGGGRRPGVRSGSSP